MPGSTPPSLDYEPTPEQQERISYVRERYNRWRQDRQPHERQWFLNAAFASAQQNVKWAQTNPNRLTTPTDAPMDRVRLVSNHILPKLRARRSKFIKNRPTWLVIPASPDQDDKMNARASQKALDYQWRRLHLELAHMDAIMWAEVCGRGFWWIYWNPTAKARVRTTNPQTGQSEVQEALNAGDIGLEVGSPFELLVSDNSQIHIGNQPEIIRCKMRVVSEVKARYPDHAPYIQPSDLDCEVFRYERQISSLSAAGYGGTSALPSKEKGDLDKTLVLELFQRPTADYPKGRHTVVAGEVLLKDEPELPYGFDDMANPFPVVEFVDMPLAGRYCNTTLVEQLISLQREFNLLKSKLSTHVRKNADAKLMVAAQQQVVEGALSDAMSEQVTYVARPSVSPPYYLVPPPISQDVWRLTDLILKEFEDISQIFPASEGKVGTAASGFQTNLLQEAADAVHLPDVRLHELAIEDAAYKIRRLMKLGYTIPRLITAIGKDYEPDVIEFSANEIDEYADIVVESGSALPQTRYARIDSVMNMFKSGILGDPTDGDVRRRALSMMEMGTVEEVYDFSRRDIDRARVENAQFAAGGSPQPPVFFDNHKLHYEIHCDDMKTVGAERRSDQEQRERIAHVIKHAEFMNPQSAAQLAVEFDLVGILKPSTQQLLQTPAPVPSAPPLAAPPQAPPPVGAR